MLVSNSSSLVCGLETLVPCKGQAIRKLLDSLACPLVSQ